MKYKLNLSEGVPWVGYIKYFGGIILFLLFYFLLTVTQFPLKDSFISFIFNLIALVVTLVTFFIITQFKDDESFYINSAGRGETESFPKRYLGIKKITRIMLYVQISSSILVITPLMIPHDFTFMAPLKAEIIFSAIIINAFLMYLFVKESSRVGRDQIIWWSDPEHYGYKDGTKQINIQKLIRGNKK